MQITLQDTEATKRLYKRFTWPFSDRERGRRFFLAYCVAMILAYAILAPEVAIPGFPLWGPGDFTIFYTAAHMIRDGNAHRLYDLGLQAQVQQEILAPYGRTFADGLLPYNYPPFFAVVFIPFSFLPFAWAFHLWNIANVALILASVKLLLHQQGRRSVTDFLAAGLVVFAFFPVFRGLLNGQSSFLALFTLTLTYLALKRNRSYFAGVALALGLIKPQLVIPIAAFMLYRRRWRMLLAFSVTSTALLIISWVTAGTSGMLSYVDLVGRMSNWNNVYGFHLAYMPNLRGTVYRFGQLYHAWFDAELSSFWLSTMMFLLSAFVVGLVFRTWRGRWEPASPEFDLQFGQTLMGGLLLSPHLYGHDLVLLILIGFLVSNYLAHQARHVQARSMIVTGHVAPLFSLAVIGTTGQAQVVALLLALFMLVLSLQRSAARPVRSQARSRSPDKSSHE